MSSPLFPDDVLFLQRLLRSQGLYEDTLDGEWGPHTDRAVAVFEERSAQIAAIHGSFDQVSERCIQTLHLTAQAAARQCLRAILDAGMTARILSGARSYTEQNALYRKGRFGNPGPVVTRARGGQSNHNFGIAWDIGIFLDGRYLGDSTLYTSAGTAALAAGISGLEWGGTWTGFKDRPHFQLASGLSPAEIRGRFESGLSYV